MNTINLHMSDVSEAFSPQRALQSSLPTSTPNPDLTYVAPSATRLFPTGQHPTNPPDSQQPIFNLFAFSPTRVGHAADLVCVCVLFVLLYRTYRYIYRRRNGLVGPSTAPLLIKCWSLYGIIEFACQVLSLYLLPLQADWFISATRALILLLLIADPHLRAAELLYDRKLRPFFDTHAPDIERQFALARKHWDEVNEAFRELATYLLKRIAVGGLANAVAVPSAEEESHAASAQHFGKSNRDGGAPLPKETAVFPTARKFFAGEAGQRADTVINAHAGSLGGAIQVAIPEAPRPMYDEARALRERFRNRLKKAKTSKGAPS